MKKLLFTVLSALISLSCFAQFTVKNITAEELPKDVKFKATLVSAITWEDENGTNYVLQSETPLLKTNAAIEAADKYEIINVNGVADTLYSIEAEYRIKGLFVYHYAIKKGKVTLLWKNLDNVSECSYKNLTAEYLNTPIVTDIDKDGIGEVWFVYQLGCRADKSVALGIKLMLYKNNMRYGIRGMRLVKTGNKVDGGESRADKAFMELPQEFKTYAKDLWDKYKEEK